MLRVGENFGDLPIRAAAYPSRNAADDLIKVVTMFEPVEPGVKLTAAMVGLFDARSRLVAQWVGP
jgi:hypothetical protein